MPWPKSRHLHADAGPAGSGQALVGDEPQGKSRQDRREDHDPSPLRHIPDGRGRDRSPTVRRSIRRDRAETEEEVRLIGRKIEPAQAIARHQHRSCMLAASFRASQASLRPRKMAIFGPNSKSSGKCQLTPTR